MQTRINFHVHDFALTDTLREAIISKFSHLEKRGDHLTRVDVTLKSEGVTKAIKATVHVTGKDLHAEASSEDLYTALDSLVDKLNKQIVKHREKTTAHHL